VIGVVEDDPSMLKALGRLLRSAGFGVVSFSSAEEFLAAPQQAMHCLVLDVHFQGMSGVDLEAYLTDTGRPFPVVFITAHDDPVLRERIESSGRAYLRKPLDETALFDAIQRALASAGRRARPDER
jgi:FixJ family two-component response regulator